MEPQIQYCTTADGVSIAYYVVGDGPVLLVTPTSWESISADTEDPFRGSFFGALAQHFRLVRYDRRGAGMSDRERSDFTADADVRDLEAVVDAAGIRELGLVGLFHLGPAAITYAARHPERVSHLILYGTYACGPKLTRDEIKKSLVSMLRSHWGIASRTIADMVAPGIAGETLDMIARNTRASVTGDMAASLLEMAYATDVTDALEGVLAPTLVLHRAEDRAVSFRHAQMLAARIPHARLVKLQGNVHFPWLGDSRSVLQAIEGFVLSSVAGHDAPEEEAGKAPEGVAKQREETSAFRTILFTDIVGHTEMMQRLGDDAGRAVLREHERITRETLKQHGGAEVKTDGDSFMASFTSVSAAVECAVALQRAFAQYGETTGEPIIVRMGLNVGEPIEEGGDFFGSAVILGARIKDQAAGGEILVPEAVRHLLSGKPFLFADRGVVDLKGFEDPVRLYEVRWREAQSSRA